MSELTNDRNDPRLTHGTDDAPVPQAEAYLVLSDSERAKGFVRPVRETYVHVGRPGPRWTLRELTPDEKERWQGLGYIAFEVYPERQGGSLGRFWTTADLDAVGKGCGRATSMSRPIAETYARQPHFYGATYCATCQMHRPVGVDGEFVWLDTDERVGT